MTGLAFISANLGAVEIIGMAANGAQYGMTTVHYYWIGAVPAMLFLGVVMMPFYYGSKVRCVPEYMRLPVQPPRPPGQRDQLRRRPGADRRRQPLRAGPRSCRRCSAGRSGSAIVVGAAIVLAYITLGGLSAAIYNEVLQFFVIVAGAAAADRHRPAQGRRLERPEGRGRRHQARRGRACTRWHGHRQHRQPARRRSGSASSSASASCCRSATGRRTSSRSSGRWRPRT